MTPAAVSVAAMIALSVLASGLCVAPPPEAAESLTGIEDAAYPASLGEFFATLDSNGDGQIEQQEAASFISNAIGGADYDTLNEQLAGAKSVLSHLDVDDGAGSDARATVSVAELDQHLHRVLSVSALSFEGRAGWHAVLVDCTPFNVMLLLPFAPHPPSPFGQGVRVWEWVRHGLGLPQYADAFKAHAITVRLAANFVLFTEGLPPHRAPPRPPLLTPPLEKPPAHPPPHTHTPPTHAHAHLQSARACTTKPRHSHTALPVVARVQPLDFPALQHGGGAVLDQELGVSE